MTTGFTTETVSEDNKNYILEHIRFYPLAEEPEKESICCFDVNQDGWIAVGTENLGDSKICVYDANGVFQYGVAFSVDSSFNVIWDDSRIVVYIVRGDLLLSVAPDGTVEEIESAVYDNDYYLQVNAAYRTVNSTRYQLKGSSQITAAAADGEKHIIYDASRTVVPRTVMICLMVSALIAYVCIGMVNTFRRLNRNE